MKLIFSFIAISLVALNGCANPTAVTRDETSTFKEKFPDHILTITSGDRHLQYAWNGDPKKRALLFVHGSSGSWEGWVHYLLDPKLRENFQIIAVDRPGYGDDEKGSRYLCGYAPCYQEVWSPKRLISGRKPTVPPLLINIIACDRIPADTGLV